MHKLLPFAVLIASPGLLAQTTLVAPAHFTAAEGPTYSTSGLASTSTPSTTLLILDEMKGRRRTVRSVAFRLDGSPRGYAASSMIVTAFASTAKTPAATPDKVFASNHGGNKTRTNSFSLLRLPAMASSGPAGPFELRLPFATPFVFDGNGPLCLEIQVGSRTNASAYRLDYAWRTSTNPGIPIGKVGVGCAASANNNRCKAYLNPSASANWPSNAVQLRYAGGYLPPNQLATLLVGTRNDRIGSIALPFELPGTANAHSLACTIYNDVFVAVPGLTNASGSISTSVGFSVHAFFNGLDVYGQLVAADRQANAWGLVTTNGVHHNLVAPYGKLPIGMVWANGSLTTGAIAPNAGYVVQVEL